MKTAGLILVSVAALTVAPIGTALAGNECLVTYEEFEEHVRHIDLPRCPRGEIPEDRGFCRLSFHGEKAVVYAFEARGDEHCLVTARAYPVESLWP